MDTEKATLDALAADMIPHLPGFDFDRDGDVRSWGWCAQLIHADGRKIQIKRDGYGHGAPTRVEIRAIPGPKLTASVSRGGKAIAADVIRKLLPVSADALADKHKRAAEAAADESARAAVIADLLAATGGKGKTVDHQPAWVYLASPTWGHAAVNHNGSKVDLVVELSPEMARKVIELITAGESVPATRILIRDDMEAWESDDVGANASAEEIEFHRETGEKLDSGEWAAYSTHVERKCPCCGTWNESAALYGSIIDNSRPISGQYDAPAEIPDEHLREVAAQLLAE